MQIDSGASSGWHIVGRTEHGVSGAGKDLDETLWKIDNTFDNTLIINKRGKVRNQIRHETDPTVLAENKEQRAAITAEITALRNRVKCVKRISKDAPRLLNLLRTELQREYERKHPIKEQQRQRTHRNEPER